MSIDDFLSYLERNQNMEMRKWSPDGVHKNLVRYIMDNPYRIGIEGDPCRAFQEVNLEKAVGLVDIVFVTNPEVYIVEAKVIRIMSEHKIGKIKREINQQLWNAYFYFKEHLGVAPVPVGVYKVRGNGTLRHYTLQRPVEDLVLKPRPRERIDSGHEQLS
ncbi:MAG: hypothetical protein V1743_01000 [Nanoarchaeota archaeon]